LISFHGLASAMQTIGGIYHQIREEKELPQ
jgi:hypothetical protein